MFRSSRFMLLAAVLGLFGSAGFAGCGYIRYLIPQNPMASTPTTPPTHAGWNTLLKQYVDDRGLVNYRGLRADSLALNTYLQDLSAHLPSQSWTADDRLAYWINAYNAFTVQLIIRNYPVKSIKDLGGPKIFVNTPWDKPFIHLGGKTYTLNDIEHRNIRKNYPDNRIHLALVCAAMSCPRLRNEAYTGPALNAQLDDQGRDFLNNPTKNKLTPAGQPQLSSIFSFYPKDFTKHGSRSIQEFVNRYASQKIQPDAKLTYLPYNWALNEQP